MIDIGDEQSLENDLVRLGYFLFIYWCTSSSL